MKNLIERLRNVLISTEDLKAKVDELTKVVADKDIEIEVVKAEIEDKKLALNEKEELLLAKEEEARVLAERVAILEVALEEAKKDDSEDAKALEEIIAELEAIFEEKKISLLDSPGLGVKSIEGLFYL